MKVQVCNTGIIGVKTHARESDSAFTLCGKQVATQNRGDEDLPLSEVECKRCRTHKIFQQAASASHMPPGYTNIAPYSGIPVEHDPRLKKVD